MFLKIGDKAPEFNLLNQNGDSVSLKSLAGQRFLIWFYPKANTPGWTVEGIGFRDELNQFKNHDIKIFGVSADSVKKQNNFHLKQNFNFSLLSDESLEMLKAYKAWGLKKFMGKEYMGIHRISYIVDSKGIIEKVYEKVKTKTHAQDILNDL